MTLEDVRVIGMTLVMMARCRNIDSLKGVVVETMATKNTIKILNAGQTFGIDRNRFITVISFALGPSL